jgi:DNA-binding Lrp family transcriptional regulator
MSKISNENFITIQGWMVNELGLKGNELFLYAIIYGFSQAENQVFNGSLQYIADWLNTSKQTVINTLKRLQEKELIEKKERYVNGVKFCEYYSKNLNGVFKKFEWGWSKNLNGGGQNFLPNNIDDTINDNKNNNIKETYVSILNDYTQNEELKESLQSFIEMRKKIKGFTVNAFKLNLKKLDKLAIDDYTKIEIVNQSVMNSWKSFYELNNKQNKNGLNQLPF